MQELELNMHYKCQTILQQMNNYWFIVLTSFAISQIIMYAEAGATQPNRSASRVHAALLCQIPTIKRELERVKFTSPLNK